MTRLSVTQGSHLILLKNLLEHKEEHHMQKIYPKDRVNQTAASFTVLSFTGLLKHFLKVDQIY